MFINYLIDIDGTICEDIKNEDSHLYVTARPIEGAKENLNKKIKDGHTITYFTSREEKDRFTTMEWLIRNGFPNGKLIMDKPRRTQTHTEYQVIDNHKFTAVLFENNWNNI